VSGIEITMLSMKMMLVFKPSARFPAWELTASLQESQVKPEGDAMRSAASVSAPLHITRLPIFSDAFMYRFYARLGLSG
jgi:hypothetical protein